MSVTIKAKSKRGRPTKYRPEFAEQARKLCLLGLTDTGLADFFGVDEATIHRWKHAHADFCRSIQAGKMVADAEVADSLYRSAVGGHYVTEDRVATGAGGAPAEAQPLRRQVPPSVQAQSLWLRNRQPRLWRDKIEVREDINLNVFPPKEVLDAIYTKALAQAAERDKMLIGRRERLGIVIDAAGDIE